MARGSCSWTLTWEPLISTTSLWFWFEIACNKDEIIWQDSNLGSEYICSEIPSYIKDKSIQYRKYLLETVVDE